MNVTERLNAIADRLATTRVAYYQHETPELHKRIQDLARTLPKLDGAMSAKAIIRALQDEHPFVRWYFMNSFLVALDKLKPQPPDYKAASTFLIAAFSKARKELDRIKTSGVKQTTPAPRLDHRRYGSMTWKRVKVEGDLQYHSTNGRWIILNRTHLSKRDYWLVDTKQPHDLPYGTKIKEGMLVHRYSPSLEQAQRQVPETLALYKRLAQAKIDEANYTPPPMHLEEELP